MTIRINYSKSNSKNNTSNLVLFVDQNFNISHLKKYISNAEYAYIADLLKNSDLKKEIIIFEISSKKKIFLISIKHDLRDTNIEN